MSKIKSFIKFRVLGLISLLAFMLVIDEGMNPKELHEFFLNNSPYKETQLLNRSERKAEGLPPNQYHEQLFDLTLNPTTGKVDYSSKLEAQQQIESGVSDAARFAVPGQSGTTPWYEIGPKNHAGRSRAAVWDESDTTTRTIIAGGVSGGLWRNNDITSGLSEWTRITGVPGNLAVSVIVQDPGNANVLYLGTGESYTSGDAFGNGIYKSINAGLTWDLVFGRGASTTVTNTGSIPSNLRVEGFFTVNDIVLYDHDKNPATDAQVFAGLSSASHYRRSTSFGTWTDENVVGLWKSTDGEPGNWNRIASVNNGSTLGENVNDIEVQEVSNRIWLSTKRSTLGPSYGLGGRFWYSDDGIIFTRVTPTFPAFPNTSDNNRRRTEIASSHQNTDTHYIVIETTGTASSSNEIPVIYKTTDNFSTLTYIEPPISADSSHPSFDYTNGQSFYDLEIEVDPKNDNIIYVGGISWYRSQNSGSSWSQINVWAQQSGMEALGISTVHADQHGLYFKPGDPDKAIVVNDGGVYYSSSLSTASDTSTFAGMEKNMITTQFYTVAQSPVDFAGDDWIIGGTQDNGTYSLLNSNQNKTDGTSIQSGDGGDTFFDQVGGDYYISSYVRNNKILRGGFDAGGNIDINFGWNFESSNNGIDNLTSDLSIPSNEGDFINPAALDSNQDVYYSCAGNSIRVITGLERGGVPATFLIPSVATGSDHITALEVSPYTPGSTTLLVGLKSGAVKKITNAQIDGSSSMSTLYTQLGSVSDIHFGKNENEIYVTYYNYGLNDGDNSNIRFTSDGFSDLSDPTKHSSKEGDLPDIPVLTILNNPYVDDEVIVGTDLGVWRTANFSAPNPNWTPAYFGMQDVAVRDLDFRGVSATDNRVIAASYGRGVFVGSFSSPTNPPVTVSDVIIVAEGGTATTTTGGATSVLSNDFDIDGDIISTNLVTSTINGFLTLAPSGTGSFTYVHDGTETTTDTFYYRAFDGALFGNTLAVTINITPINDCPLVQNPLNSITVLEDASDTLIDFSAVFIDPEGSALTYTVTATNPSLLTATINTTTLTLDYTDNEVGSATVTLTANDTFCGKSESFLVTVNDVNDLPLGVVDTIIVNEGGTATVTTAGATSVLFNDTDLEGSILTAGFILGQPVPTLAPDLGTLSFLDNGTFNYTHDGNQIPGAGIATDTFFYRPYDGSGLGNTTTVTIQITHTNDCPTLTTPITNRTVMEDAADLIINIGSVFTDEELNTITLTVSNTNTPLLTATLNTATLTVDFADNKTGSSTIILYATDGVANCSTLVSSTFIITVVPQNDTPVGLPDLIIVDEGGTASSTTISVTVLANDTDTEGDNLESYLVPLTGPFYHTGGTFTLQTSGTFVYKHNGSETTTDTFTYRLSDSTTTTDVLVTININPINDCPDIDTPLPDVNVNEDAANTIINLSPNFSDAEGNPLSFSFTNDDPSIANITLNTSTLTIQYIPEQSGTTTVTISIDDSNGCNTVRDVFLVNIIAVNDPPVTVTDTLFVLEGGTVTQTTLSNTSLLTNDTDTESDALQAIQLTAPANGTLAFSSTGSFTYTHDGSETTTDSFQYRAAEIAPGGQIGNIITISITIQEVNDCPVYTAVGGFPDANEDGPLWTWNYGAEINDDDENAPMYTLTHTATSLLTATTDANGIVTFTPNLNQFGTATMTLNVNDRRGCDIDIEIPVTINPINDCPTLENPTPDISANEDDPDFIIPLANIFEDVDTTPLNYTTTIGNSSLVATSITATALIIDFLTNQSGSTFINLIALDGDISCTVDDLFTVSITPVNDPPIGVGEVISLVNGATTSVMNDGITNSVLANDSDPEGDAMTAAIGTGPVNGTVSLLANGNFTYSHNGSATVTDSFTYTPRDTFLNIGNTTTVTIYINNVPVGVTETIVLFEGGVATTTTAASTSVLSNDTDADAGDTALLTAEIGTSPLYGTLALNSDGSFIYTHLGSEDFIDSFTYIPFDGKGYGLPTLVSVTITPTNDAPVAFPDSITVGVGQTTSLLTGGMNSVLMNDTDTDGDPLTAILVTGTSSGTLVLNPGGTFSYTQSGVMDAGDSFTYKANDGTVDSNTVTVTISLTCSPCTEKTIEAGSSGVIISYQGCDCRSYDVYVPKGEVFIFCHLDGMVSIDSGSYTVLSSKVCY